MHLRIAHNHGIVHLENLHVYNFIPSMRHTVLINFGKVSIRSERYNRTESIINEGRVIRI